MSAIIYCCSRGSGTGRGDSSFAQCGSPGTFAIWSPACGNSTTIWPLCILMMPGQQTYRNHLKSWVMKPGTQTISACSRLKSNQHAACTDTSMQKSLISVSLTASTAKPTRKRRPLAAAGPLVGNGSLCKARSGPSADRPRILGIATEPLSRAGARQQHQPHHDGHQRVERADHGTRNQCPRAWAKSRSMTPFISMPSTFRRAAAGHPSTEAGVARQW